MPNFVLTFEGGRQPSTPEEGQKHMADYMAWMNALGDQIVMHQTPFKTSKMVAKDGVSDPTGAPLMGFMMVEASDMDAAIAIAQACPFLEMGTMRVAQTMDMPAAASGNAGE
jgi:hypothetical protein